MAEYLFPTPGRTIRNLLDFKARTGAEFSEDEAAADVMLALDRGDLKPIRYYVKRWSWTRYRVHSMLPELQEQAHQYRTFFRQDQTDSGQDQTKTGVPDAVEPDSQTDSGQDQTDSGQYSTDSELQIQNKELSLPRAREDDAEVSEVSPEVEQFDPARMFNEAYAAVPEDHRWHRFRLGTLQADEVRQTVTDPEAWRAALSTWIVSEYSPRNPRKLIDCYRHERDSRHHPDTGGHSGGTIPAAGQGAGVVARLRGDEVVPRGAAGRTLPRVRDGKGYGLPTHRKRTGELTFEEYLLRNGYDPAKYGLGEAQHGEPDRPDSGPGLP